MRSDSNFDKTKTGRSWQLYLPLGVAVAAAALGIALWNSRGGPQPAAVAAAPEPPPGYVILSREQLQRISVAPVKERAHSDHWEATGRITFNEEQTTPVFSPHSGRAVQVPARQGSRVEAGQPMAVLESPDLALAAAELVTARADHNRARIELERARSAAERARRLYEHEAVATKDLQHAEAELALAEDELDRSLGTLASVEQRIALFGLSPDEVAESNRDVRRRVVIRAPIDGTVVERRLGVGQYVTANGVEPLFLISDLSTLWAVADVFESDIARVRESAPAEVRVTAYPDRSFPATTAFLSPILDPEIRTMRIHCLVPNREGLLKPDMFARIRFRSPGKSGAAPAVPAGAVLAERGEHVVFVEEADGRFRRQVVRVGAESASEVVIEEGLHAGDRVVVRGALLLQELSKGAGG